MADIDYSNAQRNDGVFNNKDEHQSLLNTPKNISSLLTDERLNCKCGAKRHLNKIKIDLDRKTNILQRERQNLRNKYEDFEQKQSRLAEAMNQHSFQQEQLDYYRAYLQDRQNRISTLYHKLELAQDDLKQKIQEFQSLEIDCKKKRAEYETGLENLKRREMMVSETTGALTSKKEELEKLENTILRLTENIKSQQEQFTLTKERIQTELRHHNQRISEENEQIESIKKRLAEKENDLRRERDNLEETLRSKSFELERKLKEASDVVEYTTKLADQMKLKDEDLKKQKELISLEWSKINDEKQNLNIERNRLNTLERDLLTKSRQFDLSQSQPDLTINYPNILSESTLRNISDDSEKKLDHLKQPLFDFKNKEDEFSELTSQLRNKELGIKARELELEKLETRLNKRKLDLDSREQKLNNLKNEINKMNRDLDNKKDRYKQLESQLNDYKDRMTMLSIERNSLDGQIEQFKAKKNANRQQLNTINQRLSLKRKKMEESVNQLDSKFNHSDLLNKLNSVGSNKRYKPFLIADDQALN
ncbi:hypothetical protein TpMuguga_03g00722 [Theileria parva strain Muguga]|uniref:Uncharacterized protein n=1 Tax=Theileria parva TaxID=5875 RepID=Q4MYW9_THEPA|nr:uncharacterized protein TpMuguga_03g00722 [Theileria parva strain Muguga]EAN30563.1 hypothetical protein TpMuguga_03g00722 [Theileria parva strain Muguga]|eukprot:XP_762846.1 hypothetical protein [Theileria parva strain Muguga]